MSAAGFDRGEARRLPTLAPSALFIDGAFASSNSPKEHVVFNPTDGSPLYKMGVGSAADTDLAVRSARQSFDKGAWRAMAPSQRKSVLHGWANLIEANARKLDALDALEMGKPVSLAVFDAKAASALVRFAAEASDKFFGDVFTSDASSTVIQKRVPRGVVAAIVPWNFPTYNAVSKVAPALAVGNSVVLKPSELATQSALLLVQLACEAGLPNGVFNVVPGIGQTVGKALAEHRDVDMITFTGSSAVGLLIKQSAASSNFKAVSAECGGKSPHVVFDDGVDIDAVAANVAAMLVMNQGQVCSVGSRLLVQDTIAGELLEKVVAYLAATVAGDPLLDTTTYGPLVSKAQFTKVLGYVDAGKKAGAELVYGGAHLGEKSGGFFMQPTVFSNVARESALATEEIFGPVLSVMPFRDVDDALELARATAYGLAAYVWTSRLDRGFQVANALGTGVTFVNAVAPMGEGPGHAFSGEPFGNSGTGVEGGMAGLASFTRRQTIWFNHG
jgi:acyl-CoA reductase-like NAD-dependent aldehyde dehydrogenase